MDIQVIHFRVFCKPIISFDYIIYQLSIYFAGKLLGIVTSGLFLPEKKKSLQALRGKNKATLHVLYVSVDHGNIPIIFLSFFLSLKRPSQ